jgi:hypothetical protein
MICSCRDTMQASYGVGHKPDMSVQFNRRSGLITLCNPVVGHYGAQVRVKKTTPEHRRAKKPYRYTHLFANCLEHGFATRICTNFTQMAFSKYKCNTLPVKCCNATNSIYSLDNTGARRCHGHARQLMLGPSHCKTPWPFAKLDLPRA